MRPLRVGWNTLGSGAVVGGAVVVASVAAFAALAMALWQQWIVLPDRWNPYAPLWPQDAPNVLTQWKLSRLASDPQACQRTLAASGIEATPEPDRALANGCGWRDAVRVRALPAHVGAPFVLRCPAAVSLALWERHTLQPTALTLFGRRVTEVHHVGSYACRDIAGAAQTEGSAGAPGSGRRSEHATANALDVTGFTLDDGSRITVLSDWSRPADDPRARFLRQVHDGACGVWNVVLSPAYNAAHRDHLHLDLGPFRACR